MTMSSSLSPSSIDELFRKPNAAPKRKLEDPSVSYRPQQHHAKAAKWSNGQSPHGRLQGRSSLNTTNGGDGRRAANGEVTGGGGGEEADENDDIEAGPSLPPPDDDVNAEADNEDDVAGEDDEGRFFGGGVSKQEREVLDYIDAHEDPTADEENIDTAWLKRTALNFERKINKNAELRAKYEDEPIKFVGSEADLDAQIRELGLLSEHGELYPDFARSGCVGSLVGLLAHENTDIAIAALQVLEELTDEETEVEGEHWQMLVNSMTDADVADLLVSNLDRLNEKEETDRQGVYHALALVENLCSDEKNIERFGKIEKMMKWLKSRTETADPAARAKVSQNRQYAAEVLSILLGENERNRERLAQLDGVDSLLQILSVYRKRDPEANSDEEEFVENLFACLVSLVKNEVGADKFLQAEGVELCLIMVREGKIAKTRGLRVLDHALGSERGAEVGERLVDAAGLKTIFSTFMKAKKLERELLEHTVGIFAGLLRYLPAESAARIRTLAKFVEKDYEKTIRLFDIRRSWTSRIDVVEDQIQQERAALEPEEVDAQEPEWLSRRFDAGLFSLRTLDVVLTWLVAEDDGARTKLTTMLGGSLNILSNSLHAQLDDIDPESGKDTKEMLEALLRFVA